MNSNMDSDTDILADDEIKIISDDYVRIGCIKQDNTSFLHCLLKVYHPYYANSKKMYYRISLCKSLRLGYGHDIYDKVKSSKAKSSESSKKKSSESDDIIDEAGVTISLKPNKIYSHLSKYGEYFSPFYFDYYSNFLDVSYQIYNKKGKLVKKNKTKDKIYCKLLLLDDTWRNFDIIGYKMNKNKIGVIWDK